MLSPAYRVTQERIMIIDFRIRPPFKGFMELGIIKAWRNIPTEPRAMRPTGFERRHVASVAEADIDLMVKEMDEAGISHGVIMGRETKNPVYGGVPNADIHELVRRYPGRFFGFGGICPHDPNALEEVERCVKEYGFKGISLDPGWYEPAIHAHDEKIIPILDLCQQLDTVVGFAMSAYTGPDLTYCDPSRLMPVMKMFPRLPFVISHGCWPHVQEVMGVAAVCPNMYIIPDCYFYVRDMPFAEQYVKAANSFMKYRTLFGTGYPIRGFGQCVENWHERGLTHESLKLTLYDNAAYLLKL